MSLSAVGRNSSSSATKEPGLQLALTQAASVNKGGWSDPPLGNCLPDSLADNPRCMRHLPAEK